MIFSFLQERSRERELLLQVSSRDQVIQEINAEKEALEEQIKTLDEEKLALASEIEAVRSAIAAGVEKAQVEAAEEEQAQKDSTFPSLYPSTGSGILTQQGILNLSDIYSAAAPASGIQEVMMTIQSGTGMSASVRQSCIRPSTCSAISSQSMSNASSRRKQPALSPVMRHARQCPPDNT